MVVAMYLCRYTVMEEIVNEGQSAVCRGGELLRLGLRIVEKRLEFANALAVALFHSFFLLLLLLPWQELCLSRN